MQTDGMAIVTPAIPFALDIGGTLTKLVFHIPKDAASPISGCKEPLQNPVFGRMYI